MNITSNKKVKLGSGQVRTTLRFKPYIGQRKTTLLKSLKGVDRGVYVIKRKGTNKILYVGYSLTQLRKTVYRHFQQWEEPDHEHAVYKPANDYLVKVFYGIPPHEIHRVEADLIRRYLPRDNHMRYSKGGPPPLRSGQVDNFDLFMKDQATAADGSYVPF